ncbi:hypothetical protein HJP15_16225 [Pseudoalteromonas sp. NEC-BIFX-2020_002]|uniref:hypothetical protein n=1 Tax=Pseudoalteromonas sp. NEC-BIFX-2020_002 TaxID=2732353 RepID=UPI0014768E1C|nr:hypothetical protein [Pseudoalteromonas sp. NEC-BIFX-2020_002]NNG44452.1 hypothetical protein [Pseudoalteromonas sp. NEC-BIFX-2020_002]
MKYLSFLLLFVPSAHACFGGTSKEDYELIKSQSLDQTYLMVGLLILAIILRAITNKNKIWVPLLITSTSMYFPFAKYQSALYNNDWCGWGVVHAFQLGTKIMVCIFVIELLNFLYAKFKRREVNAI